MAARAAAETNLNDQSVNESNVSPEPSSKPTLMSNISRSSVTFFSGDNATQVANQTYESIKSSTLEQKNPQNEEEETKKTDTERIEAAILNHVSPFIMFLLIS
jgi:hypothetical protein